MHNPVSAFLSRGGKVYFGSRYRKQRKDERAGTCERLKEHLNENRLIRKH
jgi:hypothetical protein